MDLMSLAKSVVGKVKENAKKDYQGMVNNTPEYKDKQQELMLKMIMGATSSPIDSSKQIYEKQVTDLALKAEDTLPKLVGKYDPNAMNDIASLSKYVQSFAKKKETPDLINTVREILKFRGILK